MERRLQPEPAPHEHERQVLDNDPLGPGEHVGRRRPGAGLGPCQYPPVFSPRQTNLPLDVMLGTFFGRVNLKAARSSQERELEVFSGDDQAGTNGTREGAI